MAIHRIARSPRQLRELCRLVRHALEDIGVSHSQVIVEASKPFWRE
jgi:uncharacterized protein YjiS (DUF1127 family)